MTKIDLRQDLSYHTGMKIRFYHWWVYRLFFWVWTPVLQANPQMVRRMRDWMTDWLDRNARPRDLKD